MRSCQRDGVTDGESVINGAALLVTLYDDDVMNEEGAAKGAVSDAGNMGEMY